MAPPILALRNAKVSFGERTLFEDLCINISKGDRICLVGRNGSGKSTLLKVLAHKIEMDEGERFQQPGVTVTYLPQDPLLPPDLLPAEYIMGQGFERYEAESMLYQLEVPLSQALGKMSGGERRRVALALAFVAQPDVLLLDEPTNHLDLPVIEWLEGALNQFKGAYVVISHDRRFLETVSTSMVWLDRGNLYTCEKGFKYFDDWSEIIILDEARQMEKLNTKLKQEAEWLHKGVTARRKRNQGRLRNLLQLREQKRILMLNQKQSLKLGAVESAIASKMIVEAKQISKTYGQKTLFKDFSTRILKGDRIGIIGPNGAGKTTLIRTLVGLEKPDIGRVKLGTKLEITYMDQLKDQLKLDKSLWENMCETGGDRIDVQGVNRHVMAYLKDFLFSEKQVRALTGTLSGGERNRLCLAKAMATPGNLLVMDEPTNDLDMDTLDLLVEMLDTYPGTLIIVSHDRDFLNKVTTSIIAFEGEGQVEEFIGGYDDYLSQRKPKALKAPPKPSSSAVPVRQEKSEPPQRLSFKLKYELEKLPEKIAKLEKTVTDLQKRLEDADFYGQDPAGFQKTSQQLDKLKEELAQKEDRWLELEELRDRLQ